MLARTPAQKMQSELFYVGPGTAKEILKNGEVAMKDVRWSRMLRVYKNGVTCDDNFRPWADARTWDVVIQPNPAKSKTGGRATKEESGTVSVKPEPYESSARVTKSSFPSFSIEDAKKLRAETEAAVYQWDTDESLQCRIIECIIRMIKGAVRDHRKRAHIQDIHIGIRAGPPCLARRPAFIAKWLEENGYTFTYNDDILYIDMP